MIRSCLALAAALIALHPTFLMAAAWEEADLKDAMSFPPPLWKRCIWKTNRASLYFMLFRGKSSFRPFTR